MLETQFKSADEINMATHLKWLFVVWKTRAKTVNGEAGRRQDFHSVISPWLDGAKCWTWNCERGNSINTHMRRWDPYSINTHTQSHTLLSAGPMQTTSSSPLPVANDRPTASWQENHLVAAKLLNRTKHCQPEQTVWSTMTTHKYTIVHVIRVIWLSWVGCVHSTLL